MKEPPHLDALIFDFDGVIVDSEPIHLACFQAVFTTMGLTLTERDYYQRYLGLDDHDCFAAALRDFGRDYTESRIRDLVAVKTRQVQQGMAELTRPLPGVAELIAAAAGADCPLAICSGGLRDEIELGARAVGVLDPFVTVVDARDVHKSKPDPECYRLALDRLREITGLPLAAERCVACEDSPPGIQAAKGAGMKVLAITNSYDRLALAEADRIVESLADTDLRELSRLVV